jgi:hypothetical protein
MRCRGITAKGTICSLVASGTDCYCKVHAMTKLPVVPAAIGWPSSNTLSNGAQNIEHPIRWISTHIGEVISGAKRIRELNNAIFLKLTLVLIHKPHLVDQLTNGQLGTKLVDLCVQYMGEFPHLAHYREYFARKLSKRHREEAKARYRKYVHHVVTESDLGIDIADVVTRFI